MTIPFFFLPVDKSPGMTSHDVVALVRKGIGQHFPKGTRVGHMGTLDPFATGLLILGVGKATRFSDEVHLLKKTYEACLVLGTETDTLDRDGKVIQNKNVPTFSNTDLDQCASLFLGEINQVPPAFSAKKINGVRSYSLARNNQIVELKPCSVHIYDLTVTLINEKTVFIRVTCSSGTYIRSLGRDLAAELGTCGFLSSLRRVSNGGYCVENALAITNRPLSFDEIEAHALSVSSLLPHFPDIILPPQILPDLLQGRPASVIGLPAGPFIGVIKQGENTVAIFKCEYDLEQGILFPKMQCYSQP